MLWELCVCVALLLGFHFGQKKVRPATLLASEVCVQRGYSRMASRNVTCMWYQKQSWKLPVYEGWCTMGEKRFLHFSFSFFSLLSPSLCPYSTVPLSVYVKENHIILSVILSCAHPASNTQVFFFKGRAKLATERQKDAAIFCYVHR